MCDSLRLGCNSIAVIILLDAAPLLVLLPQNISPKLEKLNRRAPFLVCGKECNCNRSPSISAQRVARAKILFAKFKLSSIIRNTALYRNVCIIQAIFVYHMFALHKDWTRSFYLCLCTLELCNFWISAHALAFILPTPFCTSFSLWSLNECNVWFLFSKNIHFTYFTLLLLYIL